MQQPQRPGDSTRTAPSFYLTGRQRLGPGAILLATVLAVGALCAVLYALEHTGHVALGEGGTGAARSAATPGGAPAADDNDDPSQVDTIVLGDAGEAPVPARKGEHVSAVHPTIIVHLPRFGDQAGLIPDSASGRLLYAWLAAFNNAGAGLRVAGGGEASAAALAAALPGPHSGAVVAAEMDLRRQTGGFALLSAKEVAPGVLVFRLRDQTPAAGETLGTLQVLAGSSPAVVGSFSLRAVGAPGQATAAGGAGALR